MHSTLQEGPSGSALDTFKRLSTNAFGNQRAPHPVSGASTLHWTALTGYYCFLKYKRLMKSMCSPRCERAFYSSLDKHQPATEYKRLMKSTYSPRREWVLWFWIELFQPAARYYRFRKYKHLIKSPRCKLVI
ncbi:hypothetical protein EGT74_08740 [Chitinophaga lutea]|uniref:Uncharacterized protein n=1 Tax=Chitinophaga lutea TaxID=2488634 RepID=A0A3N4Q0E9_9BACT|nr:hypothetical protein EGT74_08740 [Chitinophaga lutea]